MKRVASIDIFRALTMLMMIFVNDFAGMSGLPHWLGHAATDEDMLGFSDLVFPAFLFCVGLSIPYAVGARYRKGATQLQVIGHVLLRTLALVVMGVFSMNTRGVPGGISHPVFSILTVTGYFLIWNDYPRRDDGRRPVWVTVLQALGIALLVFLVIYKDLHGMPFRHGWWGILGLIGWAYLPCALVYVLVRGDFNKTWIFWLLTLILCILNNLESIPADYASRVLLLGFWPGGWAHPAIVATGMFVAMLLIRYGDRPSELRYLYFFTYMWMIGLGFLCHRFWIISKNLATPTWMFFSLAFAVAMFALLWWVADEKGWTRWARPISPAGTATLTCYMMPSLWYAVQQLLHLPWPSALETGIPGLLKALGFSFAIIGLTWCFTKVGLKLKI